MSFCPVASFVFCNREMSTTVVRMLSLHSLKRVVDVAQYVSFEADSDDQRIILDLINGRAVVSGSGFDALQQFPPETSICGLNCRYIFGFDKEDFQSFKVQDFFARIHTEDIEGLKTMF